MSLTGVSKRFITGKETISIRSSDGITPRRFRAMMGSVRFGRKTDAAQLLGGIGPASISGEIAVGDRRIGLSEGETGGLRPQHRFIFPVFYN